MTTRPKNWRQDLIDIEVDSWSDLTVSKPTEMLKIKFEYRDQYCYPKWNQQECTVSSVEECKRIYGLGVDCEYRIISIEKV